MNRADPQVTVKLQFVLQKLAFSVNPDVKDESSVIIEDDTTLQKLHTYVDTLLDKSGDEITWAQNTGIINFIHSCLDPSIVNVPANAGIVALAIKLFASLLRTEEAFQYFSEDKVLMDFCVVWPNLRNDPTLASASLNLIEAVLKHKSGLSWVISNEVWEKLLLPSLRSPSIFVQRKGVKVIASLVLLVLDTQQFSSFIRDLLLISEKFCELQHHVERTLSEEIRQSCLCVILVFKDIFIKTLGQTSLYSKMEDICDLSTHFIDMIEQDVPLTTITHITDVIILKDLHSFQEKVMEYGIIEQFLVDSVCEDLIALAKYMLDKGYIESFFRSSVNMHKYWMLLTTNIEKNSKVSLKSEESVLLILTGLQVTPVMALHKEIVWCIQSKKAIVMWNEEIHRKINIKQNIKIEATKLEDKIRSMLQKDSSSSVRMAVICISSFTSAADQLNLVCAVIFFQGLVFLLWMSSKETTSVVRYHGELQRTVLDALRVLVEKFQIDWRKCYVSICLNSLLCDVLKLENISTQVKVATLKAFNPVIKGFLPPNLSMLMDSDDTKENSLEELGKRLAVSLADMEWEVRDSGLEVLVTCMTLAKDKYPFFVAWMVRYNLNTAVLTALEDIEGYVRASSYDVLVQLVSIEKVWLELEDKNLQHRALAAVLWEGDTPVRKSAMNLVQALFSAGKYREEDVNNLVVNIIQRSADDADDEMRLAALKFIQLHIEEALKKAGMVDGEFPTVTFSKGKITKLDKDEVQTRVFSVVSWSCECGYLNCVLICLNDPVTGVAQKAQDIFCFLNDLINRYDIRPRMDSLNRKTSHNINTQIKVSRSPTETINLQSDKIVNVGGHEVKVTQDFHQLDEMDKAINDILHSSTLDNVSSIKRPQNRMMENPKTDPKNVILTIGDVPPCNPAISIDYLLENIDTLCRHSIKKDDLTVVNLMSLLDDVLLDGGKVEGSDGDDQHLRDCY